MKQSENNVKLKWIVFFYIAVFTLIVLIFLLFMQTVFLGKFYEQAKMRSMRECAGIALNCTEEEFAERIRTYDASVIVYNGDGSIRSQESFFHDSYLYNIQPYIRSYIYDQATAAQGEKFLFIRSSAESGSSGETPSRVVYARVADDGRMVLVESVISPVNGTVDALRMLLFRCSLIFLLLGMIFAAVISRMISRPLVRLNESAKKLAAGDYHVDFSVEGSREVMELADTLNYTAEELSRVEDLRRELLANISHDLRTPLTMITAYAEMMRDMPGELSAENAQTIIDEANRLSALVTDLLDLSRLQSGAHGISKQRFNLTKSIREVLKRYRKLVENDGFCIRFDYDFDIWVVADELKISQVAYNLINNAVNYAGEDRSVLIRQSVADGKVRISVEDHGSGIAPDQLRYIWDRYYRATDNSHQRERMGSGIGLSIVKEVMELHGERYGVDSTVGQGSVFWFELTAAEK